MDSVESLDVNDEVFSNTKIQSFVNLGNTADVYTNTLKEHKVIIDNDDQKNSFKDGIKVEDDEKEEEELIVYTFYSSTAKPYSNPSVISTAKPNPRPLINSFIDIGSDDSTDKSPISSPSKDPTSFPLTLSTENFFPENNKVQEIAIEDVPNNQNFFDFENVHGNEVSQFNDGKFMKFMNNFGSQIKKVLFSDQNYSDFQVSSQHNNKYFSLFKDFQEYKSKLTTTVVPTQFSFSSPSTIATTTTTTTSSTTSTPLIINSSLYTTSISSKLNILKSILG